MDGSELTLTFDEALDEGSIAPASAFAVTVAGAARTVDSVSVSGSAVTLTLASAVTTGETVTVSYTAPTGDGATPVQDSASNAAAAFTGETVTNETAAVLPKVGIAAVSTPVTEGTAAGFTLSRTVATDAALTVMVSVSEAGSVLAGTPPASATFASGASSTRLSIATTDDTVDEADARVRVSVVAGDSYEVDSENGSAGVDVFDNDEAPQVAAADELWSTTLTWTDIGNNWFGGFADAFASPGWSEDGQTFQIWYIALDAGSGTLFMAHDGSGGAIAEPGELTLHVGGLEVGPGDALSAFAGAGVGRVGSVTSQWSVGDAVRVRLTRATGEVVQAPAGPGFSVADTQVNEASGTPLRFQVTLDAEAESTVSVRYRTANGTARAGLDYVAADGAVRFAPGETSKTVDVKVLEDLHNEGSETMTLSLSGPHGATVADGTATGTINNTGAIPGAWITRFGRTVGSQVVEALTGRLDGGNGTHVTVGGMSLTPGGTLGAEETPGRTLGLPEWDERRELDEATRTMTAQELIEGSSFHLSSNAEQPGQAVFTAWGRFATGGFEAQEDDVTLDGDVTTGVLAADAEWDRVLAGVMVSQSKGDGSYRTSADQGNDEGTVESTMTGVYPYARLRLNDRVSTWGLVGAGSGDLTLRRTGGETFETDLGMRMGAIGMQGQVLDGSNPSGIGVNVKSDAMWVRTTSDETQGMKSAEGEASRLRLIVEAERAFEVEGGGMFVPSGEVGLRVDGGDAETGSGLEVGAGMSYTRGAVTIEGQVRALVAHEESGYEEWGASGSIRVNPSASGRGLTFGIAPVWGSSWSQTERLWEARNVTEIGQSARFEASRGLEVELGYGMGAPGARGVVTPYTGLSLSEGSSRTVRAGTRWNVAPGAVLGLEATQQGGTNGTPGTRAIKFQTELRW